LVAEVVVVVHILLAIIPAVAAEVQVDLELVHLR
jgi:hypothetical protein